MKKIAHLMATATLLFATFGATAGNITEEQAREAAARFMSRYPEYRNTEAKDLRLIHQDYNEELDIPSAYYFNIGDWGWIVMAGTTVTDPVVAFSYEGNLTMANLAPAARWWLTSYSEMIADLQVLDASMGYPDCDEWKALQSEYQPSLPPKEDEDIILLKSRWGQGDKNNPTYNMYCPIDTVSGHDSHGKTSITGCVATAMAQICLYYKYPVKPTGYINFFVQYLQQRFIARLDTVRINYSEMPMRITSNTPLVNQQAAAKLSYVCGLVVKMDYSPDGSGALSRDVPVAMAQNMKFSQGTIVYRNGNGDIDWLRNIRRQLTANRPLYMSGSSSIGTGIDAAGHAWVCDGYELSNESKYHMNWGWDGEGNGFFNLRANTDMAAGGYNFINNQAVILDMVPPTDSTAIQTSIADVAMSTLGLAYPNPAAQSVRLPYSTTMNSELTVYSIDGKAVATRRVAAGNGEVELRVDQMPSGVYIYRLGDAYGKFIVR